MFRSFWLKFDVDISISKSNNLTYIKHDCFNFVLEGLVKFTHAQENNKERIDRWERSDADPGKPISRIVGQEMDEEEVWREREQSEE